MEEGCVTSIPCRCRSLGQRRGKLANYCEYSCRQPYRGMGGRRDSDPTPSWNTIPRHNDMLVAMALLLLLSPTATTFRPAMDSWFLTVTGVLAGLVIGSMRPFPELPEENSNSNPCHLVWARCGISGQSVFSHQSSNMAVALTRCSKDDAFVSLRKRSIYVGNGCRFCRWYVDQWPDVEYHPSLFTDSSGVSWCQLGA